MMKILKSKILILALMLVSFASFSQTNVKGVLVDAQSGEVLIGASIVVDGTTIGTATALDGTFIITVPSGEQKLVLSYVGYIEILKDIVASGEEIDLGKIALESDAVNINEVRVVASIAVTRETPVAISNIKPSQIAEKLGTQEYPEILKSTPGVYATKQGGGFGDSRVNIRGFDQRNTATMINGVPVNDMENGWVYWSNWAGLADVTRTMQIQRGLGASKVAVPSLGGTLNILTKTTDAKQGGSVFSSVGADGYTKYGFTLSTGLSENDWAATISLSKSTGDGFVDGTPFESYSYFANISKRVNDKHTLAFTIFGAPQWHGQRTSEHSIATFEEKGIRYNSDYGYKNGEMYHLRRNYYHKPQAILNHFFVMNENTSITTALYASIGTGGGTGPIGADDDRFYTYLDKGYIDFDKITDENIAERGPDGAGAIMRNSVNNHNWYGLLTSFNKDLGNIDYMVGVDARYYKGEHYREVRNLLGGEFYIDNTDFNQLNKPTTKDDKIAYFNDGHVGWLGLFGQAEYKLDELSAFVSLSVSQKSYKRVDYFNYFSDDYAEQIQADATLRNEFIAQQDQVKYDRALEGQETDWQNFLGYMVKGGANYNLTDNHNVFFNAGYFARQPDFDAVFLNYINLVNDKAENEKVLSFELGYGYRSKMASVNINGYFTKWGDKTFTRSFPSDVQGEYYIANILGVDATHMGVEMDFVTKPFKSLEVTGFISVGDWTWDNDVLDVGVYDENQVLQETVNLYVKDIRVGDAAQTTAALGINYELLKGLKFGADYNFYTNIFADFDVLDRGAADPSGTNPDSWELPTFSLIDVNLRYNFKISDLNTTLFMNVNNLMDTEYISDATDGSNHQWNSARVYYGWGRSWSVGLKLRF